MRYRARPDPVDGSSGEVDYYAPIVADAEAASAGVLTPMS